MPVIAKHGTNEPLEPLDRHSELPAAGFDIFVPYLLQSVGCGILLGI